MARAGSNVMWSIRFPKGTIRSSSQRSPTSVQERASRSFWNRSAGITGAEDRRLGDCLAPEQPSAHQEIRDERHEHQDDGVRGREFEGAGLGLSEDSDWCGLQDRRDDDDRGPELRNAPREDQDRSGDEPGFQLRQGSRQEDMKAVRSQTAGRALQMGVQLDQHRRHRADHIRERLDHVREYEDPQRPGERQRVPEQELGDRRGRTERPVERQEGEPDHDARHRDRDVAQGVERLRAKDLLTDRRVGDERPEQQLEDDHDDRNLEAADERTIQARLGEELAVPRQREGPFAAQDRRREAEGEDSREGTEYEQAEQKPDSDGPNRSLERGASERPSHPDPLSPRIPVIPRRHTSAAWIPRSATGTSRS